MIILGLSGGVDSSVCAFLLKKQKLPITAVFMKNWEDNDADGGVCQSDKDRNDAVKIAGSLGIPFKFVNFAKEYYQKVFNEFLNDYKAGLTPNPDILCNREIKFKIFFDYALNELGAQKIATGHYARVRLNSTTNKYELLRAIDRTKDQSYFLQEISQEAISKTIFPVGELTKKQVREIAVLNNISTAKKKDSTGICFIGEQNFQSFLSRYIKTSIGNIVNENGKKIGEHNGYIFYTKGQRAPVGGVKNSLANLPWIVIDKNVEKNEITVSQNKLHPKLFTNKLIIKNPYFIGSMPNKSTFLATSQIRHLGDEIPSECILLNNGSIEVNFLNPVNSVNIGQACALYENDVCLGGGKIVWTNNLAVKFTRKNIF